MSFGKQKIFFYCIEISKRKVSRYLWCIDESHDQTQPITEKFYNVPSKLTLLFLLSPQFSEKTQLHIQTIRNYVCLKGNVSKIAGVPSGRGDRWLVVWACLAHAYF